MILDSTYILKVDNSTVPLGLTELNAHLKETFVNFFFESYLKMLIQAVKEYGERFTGRTFLRKTFINYRTGWSNTFEIKESKLMAISSVKYIDDDEATQTVDAANYDITFSDEYSTLYFINDFNFPTLSSQNPQPVLIEFTAGYGTTTLNLPNNIKTAMLIHLAQLWKVRGDCPLGESASLGFIEKNLPPAAQLIYSMERIQDNLI